MLSSAVDCVQNIARFFAHRLNKAFEGMGTDDITLIRVVVSRFEHDLADVADAFEKEYGKSLAKAIQVLYYIMNVLKNMKIALICTSFQCSHLLHYIFVTVFTDYLINI